MFHFDTNMLHFDPNMLHFDSNMLHFDSNMFLGNELKDEGKYLYVNTDNGIYKLPLERCSDYLSCR